MKNVMINENQRGLLFKNGKYIKMLESGKHFLFKKYDNIIVVNTANEFVIPNFDLALFLKDTALKEVLDVVEVKDGNMAIHYVNGYYKECLLAGKHAFFNLYQKHTFKEFDMQNTEVPKDFPTYLFQYIPHNLFYKIKVNDFEKARLYFNCKLVNLLDDGTYYFWNNGTEIRIEPVDTRLQQIDITGQEMLTLDKIAIRVNFVCKYKITDYIKIHTEVDDYERQIHITLQLALREYIGKHRLDDILENKDKIAQHVLKMLKEREDVYYVTFFETGIKDLILPGEIRDIMNMVLIAEKKAQANVICRREEVASTRSLLNTAKLMDDNKTLYKLKELEHIEKICENVGNITVSSGAGILSEITKIVGGA